ncbi:MAG: hypothetical protein M1586_02075 [Patescibacteria group bacterium]|nr:hypothetical protein [Patescibacteria group bacterium]MCL5262068.1 hypothetical protein [Patescibacteria group bacterium]
MRSGKGQFIVEGMIAMGIIVSSVLGIFSLAVSALRVSSAVTDQFIAANLAAEGIEVTKNILDSNVARGRPWNENFAVSRCFEVVYNGADTSRNLSSCDAAGEDDVAVTFNEARFLNINAVNGLYDYSASEESSIMKRWIQTRPLSDLKIRAIATVAWRDRRNPNNILTSRIATDFVGWRAD